MILKNYTANYIYVCVYLLYGYLKTHSYIYLKSTIENDAEREREVFCWFTPQKATMDRTEAVRSKDHHLLSQSLVLSLVGDINFHSYSDTVRFSGSCAIFWGNTG